MSQNYGIKVSNTGKDISSNTDEELAWTSKYPLFKVFMKGSVSLSSPGTVTIAHNLGYIPAFIVTGYGPSGLSSTDRYLADYADQGGNKILITADSTNLYINTSGSWSGNGYYFIFVDSL